MYHIDNCKEYFRVLFVINSCVLSTQRRELRFRIYYYFHDMTYFFFLFTILSPVGKLPK